jgi:hypothetical protein
MQCQGLDFNVGSGATRCMAKTTRLLMHTSYTRSVSTDLKHKQHSLRTGRLASGPAIAASPSVGVSPRRAPLLAVYAFPQAGIGLTSWETESLLPSSHTMMCWPQALRLHVCYMAIGPGDHPGFGILFYFLMLAKHSNCAVVSLFCNLHLSHTWLLLCIFCGQEPVKFFWPCLNWVLCSLIIDFESSLYILDADEICKCFPLVLVTFCHCDKTSELNKVREKNVFWLTVSEVSVHGWLWAQAKAEYHGVRSMWRKRLLTSW